MMLRLLLIFAGVFLTSGFDGDFKKTVDFILNEIDPQGISKYLRNLTLNPHMAGTKGEHNNARMIEEEWKTQGLDEVHITNYDVLLSYPDEEKPNYARIIDQTGQAIWKSQGRSVPIHAPEEFLASVPPDFNAYSPTGTVSGEMVYANFGTKEDFEKLAELGISLEGRIVIARYGRIFRANIVNFAKLAGALGVFLYSDPQQYAPEGHDNVYDDGIFMPGTSAAFGTTKLIQGDPLTPFYPAIESAFRIPEEEAELPGVPVMPLSYNDAEQILKRMTGPDVTEDWQGGLNFTYKYGPGFVDNTLLVSMEVNTHNQRAITKNVIGVIKGSIEPDRYVILGNHRDAWVFGALDPSSGTAVMIELTRTLTEYMKKTGWRPRRTMIFCSWGSEEFGLIGSSEWTEQFGKQLSDRGVAYLNVDMAIEGNHTLRTFSAPLLYKACEDVTKHVPNPNPEEVNAGRTTVFDTWLFNSPSREDPSKPVKGSIGSASDYKSFQHNVGIPCMDYRYTHDTNIEKEPLYHTIYETYFLVSEMYDIGFHYHASVAQAWGILGTYLADIEILPFGLTDYANYIVNSQTQFKKSFQHLLGDNNISVDMFLDAGLKLLNSTKVFEEKLASSPPTKPLEIRRINDQMMQMERAFIDPRGLPGRPDMNHVFMAPSSTNSYAASSFSGLSDVWDGFEKLTEEDKSKRVRTFQEHLAASTQAILTASKIISEDLW